MHIYAILSNTCWVSERERLSVTVQVIWRKTWRPPAQCTLLIVSRAIVIVISNMVCSLHTHTNIRTFTQTHTTAFGCHNLWPWVDIPGGPVCVRDIQLSALSDLKCHLLYVICRTHVSLWAVALAESCQEQKKYLSAFELRLALCLINIFNWNSAEEQALPTF